MTGTLRRRIGLPGAILMGLGSIVGTGVFVSLGLAADVAGGGVVPALVIAAVLAGLNGLSSAQLAADHPVSGGTYEYAYERIGPFAGFSAGWLFLAAKTASAATAALGLAGYLLALVGAGDGARVPVALVAVATITALVYGGVRKAGVVNTLTIGFTIGVLALLAGLGLAAGPSVPSARGSPAGVLGAAAILFVAFTGYGRIATLGEEVVEPRRTIPRAVVGALAVVLVLYVGVAVAATWTLGADEYARLTRERAAPLEAVAHALGAPWLAALVAVAAVTAMLGVMLNLVLGLSRVVLAMGRRGDLPRVFARVDATGTTPGPAVVVTGLGIAALVAVGSVETNWTFSAFTVLVYYALTNASALRLPPDRRLYPRWTAAAGLVGCLFLAVWVEPWTWAVGAALLAVGHLLRFAVRR